MAHVSLISGPAAANKSQKITFGIGHGCEIAGVEADTYRVRIDIPAGVTSVRALTSDFGKPRLIKEAGTGKLLAVEWQKPIADLQPEDFGYYEITLRAKVEDVPFTQIKWDVHQTCRNIAGTEVTVDWNEAPGGTGSPSPMMTVVPVRTTGWNKFVLPAAIPEDSVRLYLADALIAWRGAAAYSSNPNTAATVATTPGVTALTGDLAAGVEIWVKY
ncbi:MAG: DUF1775 domain-containing protein [Kofleriaceae bacterium]